MLRTIALSLLSLSCLYAANVEIEKGIADNYLKDQGITKDSAVIYATGFEQGVQAPLTVTRKGVFTLKDKKIAHSGTISAQITATKNVDEGGDLRIKWKKGVDECYMRVYVRFDKNTLMPHHFINLSGHTPTYKYRWGGGAGLKPPGGSDGAFGSTLEPPSGENGKWKFYSYWHEMHSWQTPHGAPDGRKNSYYGNNFYVKEGPTLRRDDWICLELMIKLNDIGQHNGEQAFWIDGKKISHWKQGNPEGTWMREYFRTFGQWNTNPKPFKGFSWRTHNILKINKANLQWYLSKDQSWKKMTSDKNIVYFDDLVIATKYIGPMKK